MSARTSAISRPTEVGAAGRTPMLDEPRFRGSGSVAAEPLDQIIPFGVRSQHVIEDRHAHRQSRLHLVQDE